MNGDSKSSFEVVTDQARAEKLNNSKGLHLLKNLFENKIIIRGKRVKRGRRSKLVRSQIGRFLEEPILKAEYTYIGDIDILLTEPLVDFHVKKMQSRNLCFDNEIRQDLRRLTGLHFVKTNEYYNATRKARTGYNGPFGNDEDLLCRIVESSFGDIHKLIPTAEPFKISRPLHGTHLSLRRRPISPKSKMRWGLHEKDRDIYKSTINSPEWVSLKPYMPIQFIEIMKIFEDFFDIK